MSSTDGLNGSLNEALTALSEIDRDLTDNATDLISRVEQRIKYMIGRVALLDPGLAPESALTESEGQVAAAVGHLRSFQQAGDEQQLIQGSHALGQAIRRIHTAPLVDDAASIDLAEPLAKVRNESNAILRTLEQDVATLTKTQINAARKQGEFNWLMQRGADRRCGWRLPIRGSGVGCC